MPKLFSSGHIVKVLQRHGFSYVSQRGSHVKFRNHSKPIRIVIVPAGRKEIPYGTFKSIVRQSGLNVEVFGS